MNGDVYMDTLKTIEEIVANHAGPITKFVIKKQLKDMGIQADEVEEYLKPFVERVVDAAIYDPNQRKKVIQEILSAV